MVFTLAFLTALPENIDIPGMLAADNVIALVSLALAFLATRCAKPDIKFLPINLPTWAQPWFAGLMSEVFAIAATAIYNAASAAPDLTWKQAGVIGLRAWVGAIFAYAIGVKSLRRGKDITLSKPPPPL
jgi:hypothetical protein